MKTIDHVCVLIPARNEERLLTRCLRSVLAASEMVASQYTVDIVLCVDSSTDRTLEIGRTILGEQGAVLKVSHANVGMTRKSAAQAALTRYKGSLARCWMANTDADCEVPRNWLFQQILKAEEGNHGITGIVKVDSYHEHQTQVKNQFLKDYIIYDDGTHPHVHGANLGIRADIYTQIGGWSALATAEDHDLWNRLTAPHRKISDANMFVITSGRKLGRAPQGFAGKLNSYNQII